MKKLVLALSILNLPMPFAAFANTDTHASKQPIYTKNAPAPIGTYSQAIKANKTIYISGQIPIDPKTGNLVPGDFKTQFKQAVSNLQEITKSSGGNLDNIVKLTIYLTDLNNFPIVNEVMKEYFHEPYPARAVVEISKLPKSAPVEIEAVMER